MPSGKFSISNGSPSSMHEITYIEHILVVMQCCHSSTRGPLREKHVSMVFGKHNDDVIGLHIVQEGCHMPYLHTWAAIAEG